MRKKDKLKNYEQANLMFEQSYLKSKGLLKEEDEKSLMSWKNQLEDRFKKNNYEGGFTQNNNECLNFEKIVREKLDKNLVVVCLGDGGHIYVTVNKNNLDEMFKIVDSIKSFLPDNYGGVSKTSSTSLQILKEK